VMSPVTESRATWEPLSGKGMALNQANTAQTSATTAATRQKTRRRFKRRLSNNRSV